MNMGRASILLVTAVACLACSDTPTAPIEQGAAALRNPKPFTFGEQQPIVDAAANPLAIYPVGSGQILAQTFTPSKNGLLGYIQLPVSCSPGVLLNIKIRDGLNGPILYDVNVLGLPEIQEGAFQLLQVYDPAVMKGIKIKKGHEYAFELAAFPGPSAVGTSCSIAQGPAGDSYAGGQGYYQDPINGPAFLPMGTDLPFITEVL